LHRLALADLDGTDGGTDQAKACIGLHIFDPEPDIATIACGMGVLAKVRSKSPKMSARPCAARSMS